MKKPAGVVLYQIGISIVILGNILNWFIDVPFAFKFWLNTAMFCLIGIGYITVGISLSKTSIKAIFLSCGCYLILMNVIDRNTPLTLLGIFCILTPLLLGRFYPKEVY
jgi:hypothetical protein